MHRSSINLSLDLLEGCSFSCPGCTVDKGREMLDMTPDDMENILRLARGAIDDKDGEVHELAIGPTDFMSANNGRTVLEHPLIQELLDIFPVVNIPLSLMSPVNLKEFAELFDELAPDTRIRIAVPVTIRNALRPKYVEMLQRHIQIIYDNLKCASLDRVYMTINLMGDDIDLLSLDTLEYLSKIEFPVRQTREFFFGHSRTSFNCLIKQSEFLHDYRKYTKFMSSIGNTRHYSEITPNPHDSIDIIYRNSKLYYAPNLREGFIWWDDRLEIPKPWSIETVSDFRDNITEANMADTEHSRDCETCCHFFECNIGDVKTIMRMLSIKDCMPQIHNRVDLIRHRQHDPEEWKCGRW